MTRVLIVYGSRHGGTQGIAERIGAVLRSDGLEADVEAADRRPSLQGRDAFVVGSGVYMGSWLKEAVEFLERNAATLAKHPLWLFSSGPLPGSSKEADADPLTQALGPAQGPGSGGHRKIIDLSETTHPRDHRVFQGAYDPNDPPRSMSERVVRMMPASKKILPAGDFRDWDNVEAWAHEIAASLQPAAVPG